MTRHRTRYDHVMMCVSERPAGLTPGRSQWSERRCSRERRRNHGQGVVGGYSGKQGLSVIFIDFLKNIPF